MNIHYITLRANVHATESDERVRTALSLFLFNNEISESTTEGHFGNPITVLQGQIKGKDCRSFIELLKANLTEFERDRIRHELSDRVDDDCCFHLRFDKQAAFSGKVMLAASQDSITARIKLKAYPASRKKAIEAIEMLL